MARTAIGLAIGIVFVSSVVWVALDATPVECEICVDFKGRRACSIARAEDRATAEMQALSGACSQVTGGVTETLECDRIEPSLRRCEGG